MLMCVIEAQNVLAEVQAGDPIKHGKLEFRYGNVQITLKDLSSPKGRFLNNIAAWTLRGMAEWMNQFEMFKELTVGVYYNQYYCGTAVVKKLLTGDGVTANATETATAVSKTVVSKLRRSSWSSTCTRICTYSHISLSGPEAKVASYQPGNTNLSTAQSVCG